MDKHSEPVQKIKEWIDHAYADGRQTVISDEEMRMLIAQYAPELTATDR